jgi:general nucleoside transport system permease protein
MADVPARKIRLPLELLVGCAAAGIAVAVLLGGLALAGFAPDAVLATAWRGIAGSPTRVAILLQEATPLLLTGLAAGIAFRCGVLNIGLEGQYLLGAVAAVAVLTTGPAGWPMPWLATLVGAAAGVAWCAVAVALERGRGVPLVLSTILLNVIALHLVGALVQGPLHDPGTSAPQSALVPETSRLLPLVTGTALTLAAPLALGLALIAWLVQTRTVLGFELTVTGLNPLAAGLAGIPVARRALTVSLASGALAGAAGALQVAGVSYFLSDLPTSYGYAGIAVALLGRLHPLGLIPAALFFAGLDLGSRQLERRLEVPHDLGDVAKGLAVAIVLLAGWLTARKGRA